MLNLIRSAFAATSAIALLLLVAFPATFPAIPGRAMAGEFTVGDLVIESPTARATPPKAPVSGGYMTIRNLGNEADRLIGGSADFAGGVEIHEMSVIGDVMQMREVEGGLEIPAGGEVVLKPGGFHVMFMKLSEQLKEGEKLPVTLVFQNAGSVDIEFDVKTIAGMKHASGD